MGHLSCASWKNNYIITLVNNENCYWTRYRAKIIPQPSKTQLTTPIMWEPWSRTSGVKGRRQNNIFHFLPLLAPALLIWPKGSEIKPSLSYDSPSLRHAETESHGETGAWLVVHRKRHSSWLYLSWSVACGRLWPIRTVQKWRPWEGSAATPENSQNLRSS